MARRLTQQEYEQKVYDCVGDRYSVISPYEGKTKPVTFHCNIHNIDFTATAECFMRGPDKVRCSCPKCVEERNMKHHLENTVELECSYCGKKFRRAKSKTANSKSGLYFCCREHKDLAQQISFGLKEIWPEHYDVETSKAYRPLAFRNYPHKCAICGWDEDESILEVHHIDECRNHNQLDNLIILCPICHRKLTNHTYKLIGREQIVPIK